MAVERRFLWEYSLQFFIRAWDGSTTTSAAATHAPNKKSDIKWGRCILDSVAEREGRVCPLTMNCAMKRGKLLNPLEMDKTELTMDNRGSWFASLRQLDHSWIKIEEQLERIKFSNPPINGDRIEYEQSHLSVNCGRNKSIRIRFCPSWHSKELDLSSLQ